MAISNLGLQQVADTIFLYKGTREPAWTQAGVVPSTVIADSSGNGYDLTSPETCYITNGPAGKAGWDDKAPTELQFARRFFSSATAAVQTAVTDAAVPAAAQNEHTLQVCFKYEWDFSSFRTIHGTSINTAGGGIGNDFINRIGITTSNELVLFTENNDTNVNSFSSTGIVQPGKWQMVTFVMTVFDATTFNVRIFVHTLESNGTVSGGFDLQTTGQRCNIGSGLTDGRTMYGATALNDRDYIGDIALGRFVKSALSDVDVNAQAIEFLTTGELADYGTNDLYRHEFNERPEMVDEGPLGSHIYLLDDVVDESEDGLDLLGTGGRIRRATRSGNSRYVARTLSAPASLQNLLGAAELLRVNDLFNDTVQAIPEWTMQAWGSFLSDPDQILIQMNQASGESLASNHVTSINLRHSDGGLGYFAERGSGTNISAINPTGSIPTPGDESRMGLRLYTIRYGDDPSSPGTPIVRVSIDDQIDVATFQCNGVPQGGDSNTGLVMAWTAEGYFQEQRFVWRQISDQDIADDFANVNLGGGSGGGDENPPTVTNVSPASGTTLATASTPVSFDVTDLDPGVLAVLVTVKFANRKETQVVYDGSKFVAPYDTDGSSVTPITDGFSFVIQPDGQWLGDIEQMFVYAIDANGNLGALP